MSAQIIEFPDVFKSPFDRNVERLADTIQKAMDDPDSELRRVFREGLQPDKAGPMGRPHG